MMNGSYEFDVRMKNGGYENVQLNMGGMHNIENALAAITVASSLGIDKGKIKKAVAGFRGVKRRFEYVLKNTQTVFIDDYAHHPEELKALISGAKGLFPEMHCVVIFQPHLFSRTKDLADGFAEALDMADEVYLLPIYPARELPIEDVSNLLIADRMKNAKKHLVNVKEDLPSLIREKKESNILWITAGAGDIDTMVEPIKKILESK